MTQQDDPWLVEGVSAKARRAALDAATADGRAIGDWIEQAVRDAAGTDTAAVSFADVVAAIEALTARIAAAEATTRQALLPLHERLDSLSRQLAEIERAALAASDGDDRADGTAHDELSEPEARS